MVSVWVDHSLPYQRQLGSAAQEITQVTCGSGSSEGALGPVKGQFLGMDADTAPEEDTAPGQGERGCTQDPKEKGASDPRRCRTGLERGPLYVLLPRGLTCLALVLALGPAPLRELPIPQFSGYFHTPHMLGSSTCRRILSRVKISSLRLAQRL